LDADLDRLVESQADRLKFDQPQWAIKCLVQVFENDEPQDSVIANHFGQRPSGLPALFGVLMSEATVWGCGTVVGLCEPVAEFLKEGRQFIKQDRVVYPLRGRLFFNGTPSPAVEDGCDVTPDDCPDFGVSS